MNARIERRRTSAPPGSLYEVDDARLADLASEVERSPPRKAMVLAYQRDPPTTTNVALLTAHGLAKEMGTAESELSVSALKNADAFLKRRGVVRLLLPP